MTEDQKVALLKIKLGLESDTHKSKMYAYIPAYNLYEVIGSAYFSVGLLTAAALSVKQTQPELAESLLTEADGIKRKLSRDLYELG